MFNLNKQSAKKEKSVTTTEKMLIENNKKLGLEPNEEDGNYNKLLNNNRINPVGDKNYEKLLNDNRVAESEDRYILEGALNNIKNTINKLRDENTNIPLMDFSKESEWKLSEEYEKAVKKEDGDTSFWDKYVGQQLDSDQITKITNNVQSSQLLSNYETREDFQKENPSVGKKVPVAVNEMMKDADAMLYFIYRKASEESRELTEKEKQIVTDINSNKIRILSQYSKPEQDMSPEEWEELMREEQMLMQSDDDENQERMRLDIEEAKLPDTLFESRKEDEIVADNELEWGDDFSQGNK